MIPEHAIVGAARRIRAQLEVRSNPPPVHPQILWNAIKVQEETGELAEALSGAAGQNPRKGVTNTWRKVLEEAVDVMLTASVLAEFVIRFAPGPPLDLDFDAVLSERMALLETRAAASGAPPAQPCE